jgi:hypothetical protein
MDLKIFLQELCKNSEKELKCKIELRSRLMPVDYWLPTMHIGTSKSITDQIYFAWYVEIFADQRCIFRQSYLMQDEDPIEVEARLIKEIIQNIFTYGFSYAKKIIEDLK